MRLGRACVVAVLAVFSQAWALDCDGKEGACDANAKPEAAGEEPIYKCEDLVEDHLKCDLEETKGSFEHEGLKVCRALVRRNVSRSLCAFVVIAAASGRIQLQLVWCAINANFSQCQSRNEDTAIAT